MYVGNFSKFNKYGMTASLVAISIAISVPTAAQDNAGGDEIIVTGIRQSLQSAIVKKRDADVVIDAIIAEDIGQFTDENITDSIQRIPGVQVERDEAGTDGDRISIRGLGPQFVNTTVNGRSLLSSGTEGLGNLRAVNIGAFPSEVVNGVTVEKSTAAARPESGLGGSVDIQTLRPLESKALQRKKRFANATIRGQLSGTNEDEGYLLSGSAGVRDESATKAAYIAVAVGNTQRRIEQVNQRLFDRNLALSTGAQSVLVPQALTLSPTDQDIDRIAISAGAQTYVSPRTLLTFDATYTQIDNQSDRNNLQFLFPRAYGGPTPSDNVVVDNSGVLQIFDLSDQRRSPLIRSNELAFDNKTENLILGANLEWKGDKSRHEFDLYHSTIDYSQDIRQAIFQIANWDADGAIYQSAGLDVPIILNAEARVLDPTGLSTVFGSAREVFLDGEKTGLRYDSEYEINRDIITTIELGAEYSISSLDSVRTNNKRFNLQPGNASADVASASLTGLNTMGFLDDIEGFTLNSWFNTSLDLAAPFLAEGFLTETGADDLGIEAPSSFGVDEDIFSVYGQANFESEGRVNVSGNFGLRLVNTETNTNGFAIGDGITGDPQEVEFEGSDWTVLPSFNSRFQFSDNFIARLSVGRTLTRANQADLSPRVQVSPQEVDSNSPDFGIRTVQAGNPVLKPITAINYDATFEWYPLNDGAFVLSLFHKDVSDFIIEEARLDTLQGFGDETFRIISPINFSDGKATGFELGVIQDLFFLPGSLSNLGVQANYTYVDSSFDRDVGDAGFGFPGASQDNYNIGAYYEGKRLTVRAAYTYRGDYFRSLAGTGAQNANARFTEGFGQLDLSGAFRINKSLLLQMSALNVTGETRRDFIGSETTFLDYFDRGRTLTARLRASF